MSQPASDPNEQHAKWRVCLEHESTDEGRTSNQTISVTGDWRPEDGRSADELIAMDAATIVRMFRASGHVVRPKSNEEISLAFQEVIEEW